MTMTQKTTRTAVKYNSSGAAAGFSPQAHPTKARPFCC
jgi:hypothetical protein